MCNLGQISSLASTAHARSHTLIRLDRPIDGVMAVASKRGPQYNSFYDFLCTDVRRRAIITRQTGIGGLTSRRSLSISISSRQVDWRLNGARQLIYNGQAGDI